MVKMISVFSSIIKSFSLPIPSFNTHIFLMRFSRLTAAEIVLGKRCGNGKSWGVAPTDRPFQLRNPGRTPRMGRRWWLHVRCAPHSITDNFGMSGTLPGPTMYGLVWLKEEGYF